MRDLRTVCQSCSPFRVPVARLAAAQAAIEEKRKAKAKIKERPLFQPEKRRIERALIQIEEALRYLEDALGQPEPMLRPHRVQRPQHHEIQCALQHFFCHSK